jgi:serine phosphatase RsbU (regulator of sigma subunit)
MDVPEYGDALRALHDLSPGALTDNLAGLARRAGAIDVVAYLVDFEQMILLPIPDRMAHVDLPVGEAVQGTPAGQAFVGQRLVSEVGAGNTTRVWVPILEGSDCTGVLALTLRSALDAEARRYCEELGLFAGAAISVSARYSDLYNLVRRRKAMSLTASLQWDLLPPLRLKVPQATSTGVLEPAYDVGGDCFDHAVNGSELHVAIMDAMGHGLGSSVVSALAMGSYRHDRREGQSLVVMHERLDRALSSQFGGTAFVTGQLATLDLRNGRLSWLSAGHPAPLLVRDTRVVKFLECRPSLPWGLGAPVRALTTEALQPGDSVVFYTDGVIDGRALAGQAFAADGLVVRIERAAASRAPAGVMLRQFIHELLVYQNHRLRDDATLVWLEWTGGP